MRRPYVDIPPEHLPAIEDLPGKDLQPVARAIERVLPGLGVRVVMILAQEFPGLPLYMHNVDDLINEYFYRCMREEYDRGGTTAKELAMKYGFQLRHTEKILASSGKQPSLADSRQLKLFG
ncbi:hypothetical protein [Desulfobulbus elongatus]|uniref:hypothetical protein n=1 Tax=Desulfobulbus elongatus TaxID=53332 RepID=UPI0004876FB9|nr:hypothetical protein [Desulfobulbus elongatus]